MISTFDFSEIGIVIVFVLGCLTGLLGFSRVLSLLLEKYKEVTFALLTGFLVGALNKVWPWRNITSIMEKESGEIHGINVEHPVSLFEGLEFKILQEVNVLPATYTDGSPRVFLTISFFFIGIALVYLLSKYEEK